MLVKHLIPALAVIGSAAAQCSKATTTINSQAEATALAQACRDYKGSITIGENTGANSQIDISGIETIKGDLVVLNNDGITGFKGNDLTDIGGTFQLQNLTILTTLTLPVLTTVDTIKFQSLPALGSLTIGPPGITKAKSVTITDTFLISLSGIDVHDVDTYDINNNRRLNDFTSSLKTVGTNLKISANNKNMSVALPNLVWAKDMEIANVTRFSVPSLKAVNASARFDFNYFSSFSAPNLTETETGDISFVGCPELTEIDFPVLKTIGGGLLIANNTALADVTGFPKLVTVGGALKMRGTFENIEFPSLNDVKGAFDISSTTDISKQCEEFQKLSSEGGGGQIQGTFKCESDNENANSETGNDTSGGGTSGGNKDNAAAGLALNAALLGLSAFVGVSMLL